MLVGQETREGRGIGRGGDGKEGYRCGLESFRWWSPPPAAGGLGIEADLPSPPASRTDARSV